MDSDSLKDFVENEFGEAVIGRYRYHCKTKMRYNGDDTEMIVIFFAEGIVLAGKKLEEIIRGKNIKDFSRKKAYLKIVYSVKKKKKLRLFLNSKEMAERCHSYVQEIVNRCSGKNADKSTVAEEEKSIENTSGTNKNMDEIKNGVSSSLRKKKEPKEDAFKKTKSYLLGQKSNSIEDILDSLTENEEEEKTYIPKKAVTESSGKKLEPGSKSEKVTLKEKIRDIDLNKHPLATHKINFRSKEDNCDFSCEVIFNDLCFFILCEPRLEKLKKASISRIGTHLFPNKVITSRMIDLNSFLEFKFWIKQNKKLFILENDEDLKAAIHLVGNKLKVVIKME